MNGTIAPVERDVTINARISMMAAFVFRDSQNE